MRRIGLIVAMSFIFGVNTLAQGTIDHWESLVNAENIWKYHPGTSEPPTAWIDAGFNDNSWNEGPGGFGYGDNDDGTTISNLSSVYLRIKFTINDLSQIEKLLLLADYDDAFVAYINGKEITRSGISGSRPAYNQFAEIDHEAGLYQGGYPSEFLMKNTIITENFISGENILAIQVHNINATSSDLSSNFFLTAGLNSSDPDWSAPQWWCLAQDRARRGCDNRATCHHGR